MIDNGNTDETMGDRPFLQSLVAALDTRPANLRRDPCGDWRITGACGHIYGVPEADAYYVAVHLDSARGWTAAKQRLAFGRVTQDGDGEGVIRLVGLPDPAQARNLRRTIRLPKRKVLSPERRAKLIAASPFRPRHREADNRSPVRDLATRQPNHPPATGRRKRGT